MGTSIKHPVPDRVKLSFVIFDIQALWCSGMSIRVPGCQKSQMTAGLTRSGTRCFFLAVPIATVSVKGLNVCCLLSYFCIFLFINNRLNIKSLLSALQDHVYTMCCFSSPQHSRETVCRP